MKFQMIYQLTGLSYKGGLQSKKTFSEVSLHWPHDLDRILKLISRIAKSITWIPILFRFAEEYYLINPDLHPMSAKGRPWWTGLSPKKRKQCVERREFCIRVSTMSPCLGPRLGGLIDVRIHGAVGASLTECVYILLLKVPRYWKWILSKSLLLGADVAPQKKCAINASYKIELTYLHVSTKNEDSTNSLTQGIQ